MWTILTPILDSLVQYTQREERGANLETKVGGPVAPYKGAQDRSWQ